MNSVKETYRYALLQYPSLFDCPLDVSCHLFACIGNGYEWDDDGNLVCDYYEENRNPEPKPPALHENEWMSSLNAMYELKYKADMLKYNFTKDNIEQILESPIDASFYDMGQRHGYYETKPCVSYARALNFPDNVNPDWAKAIERFLGWWLVNLNHHYRVGHKGERTHWPAEIEVSRQSIVEAQKRIYPFANDGRSFEADMEADMEAQRKLSDEIISEILAEESK
jgi:hypothetical protein